MEKKNYSKETIIDFLKALEKAKIVIKGAHKNPSMVDVVKECVELTDEELKEYSNNHSVMMFHTEFSDWIETYEVKVN